MSTCDLPEFYECHEVAARKQYRCCECCAPIETGERHLRAAGKWEGDFASYRQHLLCGEACMLLRDQFGGDCIVFGSLKEEFGDMRADGWYPERSRYQDAWKQLRSLMARLKWRERPYRPRARKGG